MDMNDRRACIRRFDTCGGNLDGRPLRRFTKACCMEVARNSASSCVSAANTLKPSMT